MAELRDLVAHSRRVYKAAGIGAALFSCPKSIPLIGLDSPANRF